MKLIVSPAERDIQGLLGKLFGKGSVAAVLLAVFLTSGTAWAFHTIDTPPPRGFAVDPSGNYANFGFGIKSCGVWVEAAAMEQQVFNSWINGYLTAYSFWVEHGLGPVSKGADPTGARVWIDNYCQEHPLERIADAAEQLIVAIKAK